ncbi:MAG: hypothetical protein GY855_13595 [candidate division Zixibacteria bacterium]|nr:hypothetical protein [candidate division Zixibacteria bacterium]
MKTIIRLKLLSLCDKLNLSRTKPVESTINIDSAIEWLCRAQDAGSDDGFSRAFSLIDGWDHSYPETTGYIIPTFLDYAGYTGKDEIKKRAIKAGDWLIEQQFPEGGIPAGTTATTPRVPTIFNTGQVIFGWVDIYKHTKREQYLDALSRACYWLTDVQDANGAWTKHGSVVATYNVNTYNTRTAWALLKGAEISKNEDFRKAAIKNVEWALTQKNKNGWFENNCLTDNKQPFTHTIAYTIRGILEIGMMTGNDEFINIAVNSATKVLDSLDNNGFLAGRYDCKWNPTVAYSCLTGDCQMAIIWCKLYELGNGEHFLEGAKRIIDFVCSTQNLNNKNLGRRGGIKGSFPLDGEYGRYEYPNWAAKFFVDALLIYKNNKEKGKSNIE